MAIQTIPELTEYRYNELSYNSASSIIKGPFVLEVCSLLERCGIDISNKDEYDNDIAIAVSKFQQLVKMPVTGILTTSTYQAMILYADKNMNNEINDDSTETSTENIDESDSPHYASFFAQNRYKTFRRNRKDIKIIFGNGSITKTIKDVFMRSVSVAVDTSGNPISETYEFIARDIKESDEISDAMKYTGAMENVTSSSDIQSYIYPFATNKSDSGTSSTHTNSSGQTYGGKGTKFNTDSSNANHSGGGTKF